LLFNVVNSLTFNDDNIVVLPFKIKDDDNKSFKLTAFKLNLMSFNPVDDKPQQSI
jgi:hypothetical protein